MQSVTRLPVLALLGGYHIGKSAQVSNWIIASKSGVQGSNPEGFTDIRHEYLFFLILRRLEHRSRGSQSRCQCTVTGYGVMSGVHGMMLRFGSMVQLSLMFICLNTSMYISRQADEKVVKYDVPESTCKCHK